MRAVNGEYLELLASHVPNPARKIGSLAIPGAHKGITERRQSSFAFREPVQRPQGYPGAVSFAGFFPQRRKNVANYGHGQKSSDSTVDQDAHLHEEAAPGNFVLLVH